MNKLKRKCPKCKERFIYVKKLDCNSHNLIECKSCKFKFEYFPLWYFIMEIIILSLLVILVIIYCLEKDSGYINLYEEVSKLSHL